MLNGNPLYKTCFSLYQVSSAVLGQVGMWVLVYIHACMHAKVRIIITVASILIVANLPFTLIGKGILLGLYRLWVWREGHGP